MGLSGISLPHTVWHGFLPSFLPSQDKLPAGQKPKYTGVISGLTYTVRTTGFFSLYRGLAPTLLGSMPKAGIRFGGNSELKKVRVPHKPFRWRKRGAKKAVRLLCVCVCVVLSNGWSRSINHWSYRIRSRILKWACLHAWCGEVHSRPTVHRRMCPLPLTARLQAYFPQTPNAGVVYTVPKRWDAFFSILLLLAAIGPKLHLCGQSNNSWPLFECLRRPADTLAAGVHRQTVMVPNSGTLPSFLHTDMIDTPLDIAHRQAELGVPQHLETTRNRHQTRRRSAALQQ